MGVQIADKSLMMIFLLEECNFACPHCVREDEPMTPGYRLSFRQLQACLADCRGLESVRWVHFSGGEPTLWREGERGLIDLLLEISSCGYSPGFTTNGSALLDFDRCRAFFHDYAHSATMPIRLFLSIDTFHQNFDVKTGRAESLDNVMACKRELPRDRRALLDVRVVAVVSREPESLLPDDMVTHYESMGVAFLFVPLRPRGRALSMGDLCPDLDSDDPEDMGAYGRFHGGAPTTGSGTEARAGEVAHIVLIGDDYYAYVDDDRDFRDQWRKVGRLGYLPDDIVRAYYDKDNGGG